MKTKEIEKKKNSLAKNVADILSTVYTGVGYMFIGYTVVSGVKGCFKLTSSVEEIKKAVVKPTKKMVKAPKKVKGK